MMNNFVSSLSILNIMNRNYKSMQNSLLKIATGSRIPSAAFDPSAWAIGQRMEVKTRGLDQATRNAQNSKSMLNVADGAISSTVDILRTLKEKAIAAANGTMTDADRRNIQKEFNQYIDQIDDNSLVTFNGKYLLDGSHNNQCVATQQAMTNQSLDKTTSFSTLLSDLCDRNGEKLNIQDSDKIKISYVKDGKTYSTNFSAKDKSLGDIFKEANKLNNNANVFSTNLTGGFDSTETTNEIGTDGAGKTVKTASEENAVSVLATDAGLNGSISGFTICVTDSEGQVKKNVNTKLDAFSESISPQNASGDNALHTQIGTSANQTINIGIGNMSARGLGLKGTNNTYLNVSTAEAANAAISVLDTAINRALDQSTTIGAVSSRLDYTISNLTTQSENITNAMSVIMDADLAKEITEYTKSNILLQAAQAMLAQSNQNAAWYLSLLK